MDIGGEDKEEGEMYGDSNDSLWWTVLDPWSPKKMI